MATSIRNMEFAWAVDEFRKINRDGLIVSQKEINESMKRWDNKNLSW